MKLSFEQRLVLLFFFIFLSIGTIGYVAYKNNVQLLAAGAPIRHTLDVLIKADTVMGLMVDLETAERGYIISSDTDFLDPLKVSEKPLFGQLDSLRQLTQDNVPQLQRVDSLALLVRQKLDFIYQSIYLVKQGKPDEARAYVSTKNGKHLMDRIRLAVSDIETKENVLLKEHRAIRLNKVDALTRTFFVFLAALFVLLVISFFAIRDAFAERKRTEDEIRSANSFLDTILENIPNMIFVKDAKHLRFVRFNKAGENLLGYKREQLLGKNDYDFFPKEQADDFINNDKEVILRGVLKDIPEEPIKTSTGDRWLHTKKLPITNLDGKPVFLMGISEDITDRKKSDDEIKALNNELESLVVRLKQSNRELEAFTYSVSHDLRAPLRIINGFAEILATEYGDKLDDEARRSLGVIMSNSRHMGQLIDDLLNLSRLGRAEIEKVQVDMGELIRTVVESMEYSNPDMGAEVKVKDLKPGFCDPALIKQVWINLLSNAVKYSKGKGTPNIEIGNVMLNGKWTYYIKDNGVGFDMQYYDKLFGVFQRLHKVAEYEGTGVGLAIVQRVVQRHGGRVWAESKEGEGSTFFFTLN